MSNRRANLLDPHRLVIASQTKTRDAEHKIRQLCTIIDGLIAETRDVLFRLRPHVAPAGISILDEFAASMEPPAVVDPGKLPGSGKAPLQVFTAEDLREAGE